MDWGTQVIVIFSLIFLLVFIGVPVAASLGLVAIISAFFFLGNIGPLQYIPWSVTKTFVLSAIPLFVFMGEILAYGGLSKRIYDGSGALVGRLQGGLLHANVVSCAIFSAVAGSSVATAATIGTIAIPELKKRGYEDKILLGSLAAGGTLGILIPPSIGLIIYGMLTDQSVGELFMAGVFPGIMLASMFMVYIAIRCKTQPNLSPSFEKIPLKERLLRSIGMWPILLMIFVVIGGIYRGIFTPTEAAAVGAGIALILALAYRKLTWATLQQSLLGTVKTSAMVLFIMVGASMLQGTLAYLGVSAQLAAWVTTLGLSPLVLLSAIYLLYIFLGCFFDGTSMMVLTLHITFPIIVALGYHPIWFGIALTVLIEMAALTPPVGMNLFTIQGISGNTLGEVIRGSFPFFLIQIVGLATLTAFPLIALWLPSTMWG